MPWFGFTRRCIPSNSICGDLPIPRHSKVSKPSKSDSPPGSPEPGRKSAAGAADSNSICGGFRIPRYSNVSSSSKSEKGVNPISVFPGIATSPNPPPSTTRHPARQRWIYEYNCTGRPILSICGDFRIPRYSDVSKSTSKSEAIPGSPVPSRKSANGTADPQPGFRRWISYLWAMTGAICLSGLLLLLPSTSIGESDWGRLGFTWGSILAFLPYIVPFKPRQAEPCC